MKKKTFKPADWHGPEAAANKKAAPPKQGSGNGTSLEEDIEALVRIVEARRLDITGDYAQWRNIGFALAEGLGEAGRSFYHRLSCFYPDYKAEETDTQYDKCLKGKRSGKVIKASTLFYIAKDYQVIVRSQEAGTINPEPQSVRRRFDDLTLLTFSEEGGMPTFSPHVRGKLPAVLEEIAEHATGERDADMLILGAIVTLSSCLPHVFGIYGDREVFPNLFLFVTAPASAGKGRLSLCRRLVEPIQDELRFLYDDAMNKFRKAKAAYERRKNRADDVEPPVEPVLKMLIIPANSSATMLYQILSENGGSGLMFETEGDTLAIVFASDFGNYSDGFRKAFHHEPISYMRRKDHEFVELLRPKLSAVLSGTPRQIASLVRDTENGLFSRFLFYYLDFRLEWLDVFADREEGGGDKTLDAVFDRIGKRILHLYQHLSMNAEIEFTFSSSQKVYFNAFFRKMQAAYVHDCGRDFIGTVRRLGLITYRVAMILTVLRMVDEKSFPPLLYCHDEDFRTAMTIGKVVAIHAARVFRELSTRELLKPTTERKDQLQDLYDALPDEFTTGMSVEVAGARGYSKKTIERYVKAWCQAGTLEKVRHGFFRKRKRQNAKTSMRQADDSSPTPFTETTQPNDTHHEITTEEDSH